MVASTDTKFYVHTNNNAPQLQNAYGSMIQVLDACLVNGIQLGAVSSLTASGTTVTATFSTAHNLMQYQVIQIAGAAQSEYNGQHRVLTVPNSTTVTFALAAAPTASPATGTISASLPPLGWEKLFSSAGKAAYRSANLLLPSRPFLRVVDELDPVWTSTYAKYAKVGIVENMTDIDTLLGVQAPYDSAAPNKNWVGTGSGTAAYNGWAKWYYAHQYTPNTATGDSGTSISAGNRAWCIVGTGDFFYILPAMLPSSTQALPYGFGWFKTLLNTDNSSTFLSATVNYVAASSSYTKQDFTALVGNGANNKLQLQRGYAQTANYTTAGVMSLGVAATVVSGSSNYVGASSLANVSPFAPVFINESVLRGEMPNFNWLFQNKPYTNYQVIEKSNSLYIAVDCSTAGQCVLNIGVL
jgi:hypothetical protein